MSTLEEFKEDLSRLEARVSALETACLVQERSRARPTTNKRKSAKEYLISKEPKTEVETTLYLCGYLEFELETVPFNVDDLKQVYAEAKTPLPGNLNDSINKNIKKGLLMEVAEGKNKKKAWTLTATGEQTIEELSNEQK